MEKINRRRSRTYRTYEDWKAVCLTCRNNKLCWRNGRCISVCTSLWRREIHEGWLEQIWIELIYLPSYSPDLNPIELCFNKLKTLLNSEFQELVHTNAKLAVMEAVERITSQDMTGFYEGTAYLFVWISFWNLGPGRTRVNFVYFQFLARKKIGKNFARAKFWRWSHWINMFEPKLYWLTYMLCHDIYSQENISRIDCARKYISPEGRYLPDREM